MIEVSLTYMIGVILMKKIIVLSLIAICGYSSDAAGIDGQARRTGEFPQVTLYSYQQPGPQPQIIRIGAFSGGQLPQLRETHPVTLFGTGILPQIQQGRDTLLTAVPTMNSSVAQNAQMRQNTMRENAPTRESPIPLKIGRVDIKSMPLWMRDGSFGSLEQNRRPVFYELAADGQRLVNPVQMPWATPNFWVSVADVSMMAPIPISDLGRHKPQAAIIQRQGQQNTIVCLRALTESNGTILNLCVWLCRFCKSSAQMLIYLIRNNPLEHFCFSDNGIDACDCLSKQQYTVMFGLLIHSDTLSSANIDITGLPAEIKWVFLRNLSGVLNSRQNIKNSNRMIEFLQDPKCPLTTQERDERIALHRRLIDSETKAIADFCTKTDAIIAAIENPTQLRELIKASVRDYVDNMTLNPTNARKSLGEEYLMKNIPDLQDEADA